MLILDILVSPPWRCRPRWIYRLLCHPWRRKMSRQIENPFSDLYLPLQDTWQRVSWLEQVYQQWDRFGSTWQECRCLAIMIGDERLAECVSSCHFLPSILWLWSEPLLHSRFQSLYTWKLINYPSVDFLVLLGMRIYTDMLINSIRVRWFHWKNCCLAIILSLNRHCCTPLKCSEKKSAKYR